MKVRHVALALALVVGAGCSAPGSPAAPATTVAAKPVPTKSYTLAPKPTVSLPPGSPRPTRVPASAGLVTIPHGASVQEIKPGRSRICLGPQNLVRADPMHGSVCSGIDLVGFDWSEFPDARAHDGLRYGSFDVVGRYDGEKLTVESATVHRYSGPPPRSHHNRRTPCAPPHGGWRVVDPGIKHTPGPDTARVAFTARGLPGYSGFWLVHLGKSAGNRVRIVLNVAVTRDKAAAEQALRKVWGGALCVSLAKHSAASLGAIDNQLMRLPGVISAGGDVDRVVVNVIYDDGSLQAWVDQQYGKGLVVVRSALKPVVG